MEHPAHSQPSSCMTDEERVRFVMEVYERGQTVDALRRAEQIAPLKQWRGVGPSILAARIAANAGAPRLATKFSIRAYRTDRNHPEAQAQYAYEIIGRRGAFILWRTMRGWTDNPEATPEQQAELLAVRGWASSDMRDFSGADEFIRRAESLDPKRAWIRLQRARLLEAQDRIEEALELAREARSFHPHPFYRTGVQTEVHLLQLLDRDEEAIQLLTHAMAALQSGPVSAQLFALLSENGRWAEAEQALARFEELSPLLEPPGRKWLESQRARAAYHLGRRADAGQLAARLEDDFSRQFVARLAEPPAPDERIQLDVSFVRQHFKTCAPATLAALGRFWKMPSEHLKLAEAMCYDGTPAWQQRDWAEQNGWCVREFRVTWESAMALIARGIPFALSTVDATSAHMMAVVGFDKVRGTLLLRDPGQPYVIEASAEPFLKRYRAFGPHGMVFIPGNEPARLDGLELPDSKLYDGHHKFWLALSRHDRTGAEAALKPMEELDADGALTWEARLDLASYDANTSEQLRCLNRLLEKFPGNPARVLRKLACLHAATREVRVNFLESACREKDADPALFISLARTLVGDARVQAEANRWLRRAIRFRPMDTSAMSALADLLWDVGGLDEATAIYRFAANMEGFREQLYQSWFIACCRTRRTEEAVVHLQDRFKRFGTKSEQPAITLAWALREMEQPVRAREVLDEAIRLRPEDGYLRLRAASLLGSLGETGKAGSLLESAQGRVRENDLLRARAELAESRLDFETVLVVSKDLLQREPLALDAHSGVARVRWRRDGPLAALGDLKEACLRFPHHYGLRRLLVDFSRDSGAEAHEAAVRELVALEPSDSWARRELAVVLMRLRRHDEALAEAIKAVRIDPRHTYGHSVLGHVRRQLKQVDDARANFQHAVTLSVDNGDAISALLELARTDAGRKEDLAFVERELIGQVVTGDGLLAYLDFARPVLKAEVLLESLRWAHCERPDLWHAWAALVSQLGHMNRLEEALDLAKQATGKFAHLPTTWLDLARVHQWRGELDLEIAAAEHAFEINPSWPRAALVLATALERRGRMGDARRVYERTLQHASREAQLHAYHANLLWRLQQAQEAFAAVERALRLAPGYDWAWDMLFEWAHHLGQPARAKDFARTLTQERPGEARVWLMLSKVLTARDEMAERLASVERALEMDAHSTEAWDLKVESLAVAEQFEQAILAAQDGAARCMVDVHILNGRRAWVESRRRQLPEAVKLMRAVLVENSSYVWGWNQLVLWLIDLGELAEATKALEQLQRLRPHDAWVSRQLGSLLLRQKDQVAARKCFAAALESEPTDVNAAHSLLGLQMDAGLMDAAESTLRVMQAHQPGAATSAAEISLRLRQNNPATAVKCLEAIANSPEPDPWAMNTATDAFQQAGHAAKAIKVIRRAIKGGTGNPEAGAAVIKLKIAGRNKISSVWFFLRLKPGEIQRRAAAPLIRGISGTKEDALLLRWVMWRRREVLFKDDAAWGNVGFALSSFNRMQEVVRWLAGWRERPHVEPWMLFNLCLAMRHLGLYAEAGDVARHVIETWGHREGSADMHLFLAVEDALAGDVAKARERLGKVVTRENVTYDRQLLALTKALVEFHETKRPERRKKFATIRRQLEPQFGAWTFLWSMKDVRRTFARTRKVLGDGGAGPGALCWFIWKQHWQWSLSPLFPVFVAIALQPPILLGLIIWWLSRRRER